MAQPIPKQIRENNPKLNSAKPFYTLLVDGSNILELSSLGDKTISSNGLQTGGIFQFLMQLKLIMRRANFRYVYVFWDSENDGGILRKRLYPDYKSNRDRDFVDDEGLSDYMKAANAKLREMQCWAYSKRNPEKASRNAQHKEVFYWQREVLMSCLEDLFIRQCMCDKTEADDFIGWYVANKRPSEKIVILSNDRDVTQLISDDVAVYVQDLKDFVTTKNHADITGVHHLNVALVKTICGDVSDNIKGVKGVGKKTLLANFPDLATRAMTLTEIIDGARMVNENRVQARKKPLAWAANIANGVTSGCQGEHLYEINAKIIDLKNPLMTDEAKELLSSMMYQPLDPEGRSMESLYATLLECGEERLREANHFANFFVDFQYLIEKERKNEN